MLHLSKLIKNREDEKISTSKSIESSIIFHIGNIANNAYNSAVYERSLGLNSFAISPDYNHVMGFPFWETEDFHISASETFDAQKYVTELNIPSWFLHGTWDQILAKLLVVEEEYPIPRKKLPHLQSAAHAESNSYLQAYSLKLANWFLENFRSSFKRFLPSKVRHKLANTFIIKLRLVPVSNYLEIFNKADIIVFYGAYNAYTVISNWDKKYISLEHGTLRDYIFSDTFFAKQSKIAYENSFRVLVTNQDCLIPAANCGITKEKIINCPHPTSDFDFAELRKRRLKLFENPKNEILWPTRHSYGSIVDRGKGNAEGIRALLGILKIHPNLKVVFVEWGDDVHKSKKIIEEFGLENQIEWIGVLSRKALKYRMSGALAVLDQFTIPAYGGITADALGLGVPVITRSEESIDLEYFGSVAPVMPAANAQEITTHINSLMTDPSLIKKIFHESTEWYDSNLSSTIAFSKRMESYKDLLNDQDKIGEGK